MRGPPSLASHISYIYVAGLLAAASAQGAEPASTKPLEEISITGDQNQVNLQMAIDSAESEFYELFNDLVDEEFRVTCKNEIVLGSRIKKRVCQTGYQQEELTTAAMYSYYGIPYDATAALANKNSQLREQARELIETNAELRQAATRLSDLVSEYKDRYNNAE